MHDLHRLPDQHSHFPLAGPYGANVFNPRSWGNASEEVTNEITLEFTRVVLAVGVFAIGVELPKQYMKRHWRSLFFLLAPAMTWVRSPSLVLPRTYLPTFFV
jgi:NhaP-type Na+/H+ or K+/H+ antiporter